MDAVTFSNTRHGIGHQCNDENPPSIRVIALDIANTLESVETNEDLQLAASKLIIQELHQHSFWVPDDPVVLRTTLRHRFRKLHSSRLVSMVEPTPQQMWAIWLLPEFPLTDHLGVIDALMNIWMDKWYRRTVLPAAREVLTKLQLRGYRLACISNTLSGDYTRERLRSSELYEFFDCIVLSSDIGIRKPSNIIFNQFIEMINEPAHCIAYIGDQLSRDVVGAINAGFGMSVLVGDSGSGSWHDQATIWPDVAVSSLAEVLLAL